MEHTTHNNTKARLQAATVVSCTPGPVSATRVSIGVERPDTSVSPTAGTSFCITSWLWCIDITSPTSRPPGPTTSANAHTSATARTEE